MPKVIQVIQSEIQRGEGTKEDVIRTVFQYHDLEGNFLAEFDDWSYKQREREVGE